MNRNFRYFLFSSAATLLSVELFYLSIPLIVLALGYSTVHASWCTFAFSLPTILIRIFIAPTIEKSNKKKVLINNEMGRILVLLSFVVALSFFRELSAWLLILVSFLFGICTTFTELAERGALKSLLIGKNATGSLSQYEIRTRGVQLVGPLLCGWLISYGLAAPYWLAMVACCLSISLLWQVSLPTISSGLPETAGFYQDLILAMRWLRERKLFWVMVIITAINGFIHPILYLCIVYQLTLVETSLDMIGYILSGLGVGGIIGSIISYPLLKYCRFNHLLIGVNIFRIFIFAGFILFPDYWGYFIFFALKSVSGGVWNVCYNVYTIQEMPHDYVARITALSGIIIKISVAAGGLVAGYFINYTGVSNTLYFLVLCTIGMFVCSLGVTTSNKATA